MGQTDNPLKQLVTAFIGDFAAWLLGAEVREAVARPTELPPSADAVQSDQVFHVTLADGRTVVLHLEFQGRTSHKPMPLRMLDYMARLTAVYRDVDIAHSVLYVGDGAGRHDTGQHQATAPDGNIRLAWQYQVMRLWEMDAEQVLALGRPALLALVGQTRIRQPEVVLPQVIATFKMVTDAEQQYRLFNAFVALISDEEVLTMVEKLLDDEDLLTDTPFLRRLRREREAGLQEGTLRTLRHDILKILQTRFNLSADQMQQITVALDQVADEAQLDTLFLTALQAESLATFQAVLDEKQQASATPDNGAA